MRHVERVGDLMSSAADPPEVSTIIGRFTDAGRHVLFADKAAKIVRSHHDYASVSPDDLPARGVRIDVKDPSIVRVVHSTADKGQTFIKGIFPEPDILRSADAARSCAVVRSRMAQCVHLDDR